MKITHVNFKFLDEGGRSECIYQFSKGLAKKGHEVYIVSSKKITGVPLNKERLKGLKKVKFIGLPSISISVPSRRFFIPGLMEQLLKMDVDIIHSHGISDFSTQMALMVARIKNIPFVVSSYYHPFWTYKEGSDALIWKTAHDIIGKTTCLEAKKIVCSSKQEKNDLMKDLDGHFPDSKFVVVEPGVDPDQFLLTESKSNLVKKFKLPEERDFIFFLADLKNPRKGLYEVIKIINEVRKIKPSVYLLACGSWPKEPFPYKNEQIYPLIKSLKMETHMSILGSVSLPEKARLFLMAKCLLSPTIYESFGIALIEALYNKIPVVATKVGGTQTVIKDGEDGFLIEEHDNIKEFTQKIVFLLDHPQLAKEMGERGSQKIRENFTWEKSVKRIESIYEEISNSNS